MRNDSKCLAAAQAVMAGMQEIWVRSFGHEAGWTIPYISLRIGRVTINIEDRERALQPGRERAAAARVDTPGSCSTTGPGPWLGAALRQLGDGEQHYGRLERLERMGGLWHDQ